MKYTYLILIMVFVSLSLQAQDGKKTNYINKKNEVGLLGGYSIADGEITEGKYKPVLFMPYAAWNLTKNENHIFTFSFQLTPQVNYAKLNYKSSEKKSSNEIEAGVNVGFRFNVRINKCITAYVMPSTGAYYISVNTIDQANGYIFELSPPVGLYIKLNEATALNLQYKYRHISNAGLKDPNFGIENQFAVVGISRFFGSRK
jgi:hypothetical protein